MLKKPSATALLVTFILTAVTVFYIILDISGERTHLLVSYTKHKEYAAQNGRIESDAQRRFRCSESPATSPLDGVVTSTATLRGRIRTVSGAPVTRARVELFYENCESTVPLDESSLTETSSLDGQFVLRGVDPYVSLLLGISHLDLGVQRIAVEALAAGEDRNLGDFVLESGLEISGEVLEPSSAAVQAAIVIARPLRGESSSSWASVRRDGKFRVVGLRPGIYQLTCRSPGYAAPKLQQVHLDHQSVTGVTILMCVGDPYDGRVVNEQGVGISNASVEVRSASSHAGKQRARTNATGEFSVHVPAGSGWLVRVGHPDFVPYERGFSQRGETPKTIVLKEGASLVVELSIVGSRILSGPLKLMLRSSDSVRIQSTAVIDGVARAQGLTAGKFDLQVRAVGFPPSDTIPLILTEGQTREIDITLDGTADYVLIHVVNSKQEPLPAADVIIYDPQDAAICERGPTDASGTFCSRSFESGVAVRVSAPTYAPRLVRQRGSKVGRVKIQLQKESVIHVVVRGGLQEEPVEDVRMVVFSEYGEESPFSVKPLSVLSREGRLKIGGLAEGQYRLQFYHKQKHVGDLKVVVAEAEEKEIQFRLEGSFVVDGLVRKNGAVVSGGYMHIFNESASVYSNVNHRGEFRTELGCSGMYSFEYNLGAFSSSSIKRELTHAANVDLDFKTVRLVGRVLGADAKPAPRVYGQLVGGGKRSFVTDSQGYFVLDDLPTGAYFWDFDDFPPRSFAPWKSVVVSEDTEIAYRFLPTVEFELKVLFETPNLQMSAFYLSAKGERSRLPRGSQPHTFLWPRVGGTGCVVVGDYGLQFFEIDDPENLGAVSVRLEDGGRINIALSDKGRPLRNHSFEVSPVGKETRVPKEYRHLQTSYDGNRTIVLAVGKYQASTTVRGEVAEVLFEVVAGQTRYIELKSKIR